MNKQFSIDPHNLDEEWLQQPLLYERACEKLIDAQRQRDHTKMELDEMVCSTANDIRNNPGNYGIQKITEASIQEILGVSDNIKKQKRLHNSFVLEYQQAKNEIEIVEMKRKALENLVDLYKGQYFSVPHEKRDISGGKRNLQDENNFQAEIKSNIRQEHTEVLQERRSRRRARVK